MQRGRVNQAAAAEYYQLPSAIPPMEHGRINPCYMTNFVTVLLRAEPYPISHMQVSERHQQKLTARER